MGDVGLLLVGVVLFCNGLATLGVVTARSIAPVNFLVGSAQVVLPTLVLLTSGGDVAVLNATWPSYLFGFTYLFYGLLVVRGLEPEGFGWFSSFVAAIAAFYAVTSVGSDPVFAVVWATWSAMWTLFFVLMGLGRGGEGLSRFTGWFLVLLGIPTCTVTALFLLHGRWTADPRAGWAALGALVALTALAVGLARSGLPRIAVREAPGTEEGPAAPGQTRAGSGALDEVEGLAVTGV